MKNFEAPTMHEEAFDFAEGVFAASGYNTCPPPDDKKYCYWTWDACWGNHNSGSHSEMEIKGHNCGNKSGDVVILRLHYKGKGRICSISNVTNASSFNIDNSGHNVTIYRYSHFNPGESVSMGIPDIRFTYINDEQKEVTEALYRSGDPGHCGTVAYGDFDVYQLG